MKKIFEAAAMAAFLSPLAYAASTPAPATTSSIHEGIKVGGNIGVGFGKARHRFYGAPAYGSENNDLGIVGVDGGVNLGYDHVFEDVPFLLGFEGVANWTGAQGFQRFTLPCGTTLRTKAALKHSLQLKGRFGYVMDKTVIFAVIGWDNAYWDFDASLSGANQRTTKKGYLSGLITGAGIETYITSKVSLGIEYNNFAYSAQTFNIPNSDGSKVTLNPHHHKVMMTAKYTF